MAKKYLGGGSTSSTSKGHEKSPSSKSSWKDNLLELRENPMCGEPLEDNKPENRPESSRPSFVTYPKELHLGFSKYATDCYSCIEK